MDVHPMLTVTVLAVAALGVLAWTSKTSAEQLQLQQHALKRTKKKIKKSSTTGSGSGTSSRPESADGESQYLLNLLYSIAEDQARKEGYIHRGITCNNCNTSPIRGLRYKCANCMDYDLCEACEATEPHLPRTHVFIKLRIPIPPLANPRTALTPVLYPGNGKTIKDPALTWEDLKELQKKTHFDHVELEALYDQFKSLCTSDGRGGITWRVFEHCLGPLGLERNLITERIFDFFDQDHDGVINFSELVCGLSILCKGTKEEKIKYIFKGYDLDGDGYISINELESMFQAYFKLSLELIKDVARALQQEVLQQYDDNSDKPVSAAFTAPIPHEGRTVSAQKPVPSTISSDQSTAQGGTSSSEASSTLPSDPSSSGGSSASSSSKTPGFQWPTPGQLKPVMETLSDEAIKELVQKTFEATDPHYEGKISFEAFKKFALNDSTVTAWFEALGSVF